MLHTLSRCDNDVIPGVRLCNIIFLLLQDEEILVYICVTVKFWQEFFIAIGMSWRS